MHEESNAPSMVCSWYVCNWMSVNISLNNSKQIFKSLLESGPRPVIRRVSYPFIRARISRGPFCREDFLWGEPKKHEILKPGVLPTGLSSLWNLSKSHHTSEVWWSWRRSRGQDTAKSKEEDEETWVWNMFFSAWNTFCFSERIIL